MYYCNQAHLLIGQRRVIPVILFVVIFFSSTPLMAEKLSNNEQKNDFPEYTSSIGNYNIPDVAVIRQDGKKISFIKELDDGSPMLSHVFSKVQDKLAKNGQKFHFVSISIDPENDTPAKLVEYAHKFEAGSHWDFYTGTIETSIAIQKAFNVYRGDKMNHSAVILMRAAPGKSWLRLDGFVSPDDVIREYANLKP
jgi:protein SCO1/2